MDDNWCWSRITLPDGLLTEQRDEKGCYFGSKSTTLEAVGILIPLITFRDKVAGKQIIFKVDNIAVTWGWQKGYVKEDKTASEVLKAVRHLGGLLGTTIFIEHVGRMTNEMAILADQLSRREKAPEARERMALEKAMYRPTQGFLLEWLQNPKKGKDLCEGLLLEANF